MNLDTMTCSGCLIKISWEMSIKVTFIGLLLYAKPISSCEEIEQRRLYSPVKKEIFQNDS